MPSQPTLLATDLEGVLVPEIWIAVAERTGITQLRRTTRDEPDYDKLMHDRIAILREHRLTLDDIQAVIATIEPLPGARDFLDWARAQMPVIILSDTFYEFAAPLMVQLGQPTLFCNSIQVDGANNISGYTLRQADGKRRSVAALRALNFRVVAMGDSYNDTTMLAEADTGILFRPPANVVAEFPQYPVLHEYDALREQLVSVARS
jgi:phosphoserine/homoserine phosphotransferase